MATSDDLFNKCMIYLKEDASQSTAISLAKAIQEVIDDRTIVQNARPVLCRVQATKEFKPLARQAGKFYALLEKYGIDKNTISIKFQVYSRSFVVRSVASSRPVRIATWTE
ncbi:unnamed protein product [Prorocentrum cordatum]|uniref:40S ribosomal protein S7 n=1 Tax=Prorocentrum cordatum TaxID=2364126 RepID=A0ABN9WUX3_9DINO|nr:unnamed protein product [Polarella glacialis]